MSPIAIAAIVVAAAVLLFILLGRTALRGKKREGELGAVKDNLEAQDKWQDNYQKKIALPLDHGARAAWEHFRRVRSYSGGDKATSVPDAEPGRDSTDGNNRE